MKKSRIFKTALAIFMIAAFLTVNISVMAADETQAVPVSEEGFWLPDIISDHMLLQQGKTICLWGRTNPGETVNVKIVANGEVFSEGNAVAGEDRAFKAELPALGPGGPYEIIFTTPTETRTIKDVLMGELWIQCGQSNMTMPTQNCGIHAEGMLPEKTINDIRLFYSTKSVRVDTRQDNLPGEWKIASRDAVQSFSAIGFTALNTIYNELKVPMGGICNAISGERMSRFYGPTVKGEPGGVCYNAKLAPIADLNVRGVMWNQGSADRDKTPEKFTAGLNKVISTWRIDKNDPDLPFVYFTQSPSLMKYYASWTKSYIMEDWSEARLGQIQTYYETENTAFSVNTDRAPEPTDKDALHPANKKIVGERMGRAALGSVYGKIENWQSPLYKSSVKNGNSVDVTVSYAYSGIKTTDGKAPRCFLVAQNEGEWKEATAEIINENTIRLSNSELSEINFISYCVEKHLYPYTGPDDAVIDIYPDVNVVNGEDLPLASFHVKVGDEKPEKTFSNFAVVPERKDIVVVKAEGEEEALVSPYYDIAETDPYYEDAITVNQRGLMNGMKEGQFNAKEHLSKAMLYTVLYRLDSSADKSAVGEKWYTLPAQWAKEKGLCEDISDETLALPVTNKEFGEVVFKFLNPNGLEEVEVPSEWLIRNFIIEFGLDDNKKVTRGQSVSSFRKISD